MDWATMVQQPGTSQIHAAAANPAMHMPPPMVVSILTACHMLE